MNFVSKYRTKKKRILPELAKRMTNAIGRKGKFKGMVLPISPINFKLVSNCL